MEVWSFLTGIPAAVRGGHWASGRLPGTSVQRLAAIAHGDGICTADITAPSLVHIRNTAISTAADTNDN